MYKFKHPSVTSTVTATGNTSTAIQDVLDRKIDFIATGICNFDSIRQAGQRAEAPTTSAVLRDMLIHWVGKIVQSIHIPPVEILGKIFGVDVFVRKRRMVVLSDFVAFQDLNKNER